MDTGATVTATPLPIENTVRPVLGSSQTSVAPISVASVSGFQVVAGTQLNDVSPDGILQPLHSQAENLAGPSRTRTAESGTPIAKRRENISEAANFLSQDAAPSGGDEQHDIYARMMRPRRKRSTAPTILSEGEGQNADEFGPTSSKPRRRRRRKSNAESGGTSGTESEGRPKQRRRSTASSTSATRARSRTSSAPVYDEDSAPGPDLDPTTVTMADICQDTGQGRISSKAAIIQRNHLAWKAANKEKRERMRTVMEAKKLGREEPEADDIPAVKEPETDPLDSASVASAEINDPPDEDGNDNGFDYQQALGTNRFSARVRIGPNGETIIDEESLQVDRAEEINTANYQHIEESDQTKFTNSASYGRKLRGSRWSAEETDLFFHVSKCKASAASHLTLLKGSVSIWRKLRAHFLCPAWPGSQGVQKQI